MALLNTGLYLPKLDIEALCQGKSIVTITKRFMVPGKRFVLYPSKLKLSQDDLKKIYRSDFLQGIEGNSTFQDQDIVAWAKCEFCQSYSEKDKLLSIAPKTIWSSQYLGDQLNERSNLFLTFLQIYKLPQSITASESLGDAEEELLRGFVPLPDYLDVDEDNPVLDKQEFDDIKNKLLNPESNAIELTDGQSNDRSESPSFVSDDVEPEKQDNKENIVDSPNWFEQIARIGNSSDGNTFEKLVRKSFLELGFTNSRNDPRISLDPHATGGAGGLDFYCDAPYSIVGECKATKTTKVPDGAPAQLIKLGNKLLLPEQYGKCIKVVVAAGDLTKAADETAQGNSICVIRPETLQRLVELKISHPGSFTLVQLQEILSKPPFSQESDKYLEQMINTAWSKLQIRSLLTEVVKEGIKIYNRPLSIPEIQISYNNKLPMTSDSASYLRETAKTRDLLIELSSPLTGYLGRREDTNSGEEGFYFIRELKIED